MNAFVVGIVVSHVAPPKQLIIAAANTNHHRGVSDILAVDDDLQYRTLITQILTDAGHQVQQAEHGVEGLALCRGKRPALVITAIVMAD
jgi:PleD family two-component response regulator